MKVESAAQGRGEADEHPRDTGSLLWKVTVAGAIFFAVAFFVVALG